MTRLTRVLKATRVECFGAAAYRNCHFGARGLSDFCMQQGKSLERNPYFEMNDIKLDPQGLLAPSAGTERPRGFSPEQFFAKRFPLFGSKTFRPELVEKEALKFLRGNLQSRSSEDCSMLRRSGSTFNVRIMRINDLHNSVIFGFTDGCYPKGRLHEFMTRMEGYLDTPSASSRASPTSTIGL